MIYFLILKSSRKKNKLIVCFYCYPPHFENPVCTNKLLYNFKLQKYLSYIATCELFAELNNIKYIKKIPFLRLK